LGLFGLNAMCLSQARKDAIGLAILVKEDCDALGLKIECLGHDTLFNDLKKSLNKNEF
jgi:hypothetical protein